mgnify:CR=1 FL=1
MVVIKLVLKYVGRDTVLQYLNVPALFLGTIDGYKWFYSEEHGFLNRKLGSCLVIVVGISRWMKDMIPAEAWDAVVDAGLIAPNAYDTVIRYWRYYYPKTRGADTRRYRRYTTWGGSDTILMSKSKLVMLGDHARYAKECGREYISGFTKREVNRKDRHETKAELRRMVIE